ncbi:MAG: hypothetical protein JWQ04_917 [Pedosphaera sp.]|nr:hypothetical protein [Pedosphaera sp.]
MTKLRLLSITLAAVTALAINSPAQDSPAKSTNVPAIKPTKKQADFASTTAQFGKIAKTNEVYQSALDAHALADALKLTGKEGAFKGTVVRIFEPRNLAILNFDANYRTAMTAVVHGPNFADFPVLTNLIGKDVVITGTFTDYQGRAQMVLTNAAQVKVVEAETK